jgi:hypothetical protein
VEAFVRLIPVSKSYLLRLHLLKYTGFSGMISELLNQPVFVLKDGVVSMFCHPRVVLLPNTLKCHRNYPIEEYPKHVGYGRVEPSAGRVGLNG